jgi:hypothetical protein
MNNSIPDKLLINLKIISKIQKNGRITRSYDGIVSLENEVFYQPLRRFLSSDSRKQAVFEINSIITECIEQLSHILNSKFMNKNFSQSDEYLKNCENVSLLLNEMELAKCGIENLKFTYQNDQNITSQLDIVILKLNTTIKDVTQKLMYFHSFIQYNSNQISNNFPHQESSYSDLTSIKIDSLNVDHISGQGNDNIGNNDNIILEHNSDYE